MTGLPPVAGLWVARQGLCLLAAFSFLACGPKEVETYPDGQPKVIRLFSLFGSKDSSHLRRVRTYYFNGHPEFDMRYKDGALHGDYRAFWHNGQIKEKGRYVRGLREGDWEFYFNRFVLSEKGLYRRGLKQGPWVEYWENSELRRRGEYRSGLETGEWISWSPEGPETLRNSCFEANAQGHYSSLHANGAVKEEYPCRQGKKSGAYAEYHPDGNLLCRGTYAAGEVKDSLWECFHASGKRSSLQRFRRGVWDDSVWAWDDSGKVRERGNFRQGNGVLTVFDSLGRVAEIRPMLQGLLNGENLRYYPDGKKRHASLYESGTVKSLRRWHTNGILAAEGSFSQGKRTGLWREWDDKGRLKESAQYENGELHGERRFLDSTGALTRLQKYYRGIPTEGSFPGIPGGVKAKASTP